MKIIKTLSSLLIAVIFLAGCSQTPPPDGVLSPTPAPAPENQIESITVTDMTGREIILERPATRIVAITPSNVEILFAIGAEDLLVGRGTYCDYPTQALDIPVVESGANLNVEQVIALQPEVVLMNRMAQSVEQVQALESAGAKVIINDAPDIAGVYTSIELIGEITGKSAEAQALVDRMKHAFADIQDKVAKDEGKTIYFEISPLEYGLWTAGRGTFMDELATMLGLTNIFADVDEWGEVSEEQVIQRNPDYIVTITMYFGEGPEPVEEILSRTSWDSITAIQNGAVFNVDNDEIARPGPRLVNAAQTLYEFIRG